MTRGARATRGSRLPLPGIMAMRAEIVRYLNDTAGRRNWAHIGLRLAIKNLGPEEARWTPPGGHSVWRQINHMVHWKRFIVARVRGRRASAAQAWPASGRTLRDLRRGVHELEALHRELREAVLAMDPDRLLTGGLRYSTAQLLLGEAAHESYHIGQIVMTRKQYRRQGRAR